MGYPQGETLARAVATRVHAAVTTTALLAAIPAEERQDQMTCLCTADNSNWMFSAASSAADTASTLAVAPSAGSGAWLRIDKLVDIKVAVAFGTADAAVLFTVPTGFRLRPTRPWWEVTADFTGGSSSTIGMSSSNAAYATKGDLQGGASGDALAALTAGIRGGTVGAKVASLGLVVLVAGDTVRFDRITSAFTAGTGFAHVPVEVLAN